MDILWNMVMEDGFEDGDAEGLQEAAASAITQHMTPVIEADLVSTVEEAIQDVASKSLRGRVDLVSDEDIRQAVEQVMDDDELGNELEDKVVATLEEKLPAQLEQRLVETMEQELHVSNAEKAWKEDAAASADKAPTPTHHRTTSKIDTEKIPQTPLPEVIDFTPSECCMESTRTVKIVISTSAAIPILPPDDLPYRWNLNVAFVDMGSSAVFSDPSKSTLAVQSMPETDLKVMKVALAPLQKLTPFSYKCEAPRDISAPGKRAVILLGMRYKEVLSPNWDAMRLAAKVCIQAEWAVASDLNEAKATIGPRDLVRPTFYAPAGGGNVQLLSQLSQEYFEFFSDGPPHSSSLPSEVGAGPHGGGDESKSVGSKGSGTRGSKGMTSDMAMEALPAPPPTIATVASALTSFPANPPKIALDVAKSFSRKRTLSYEGGGGDESPNSELEAANDAASEWVSGQMPDSDANIGETVDRHCKIRFVERLANVVVVTEDSTGMEVPPADKPEGVLKREEESSSDLVKSFFLRPEKLKDVDDEALDSLLDSVLIRFVESLIDSCVSQEEMSKELNGLGYAGFALMHYAALYNMKSLIPLLLARGADPNIETTKGRLTPLHLAGGAGHDQIVDLLVRSGARPDATDSYGLTPSDHAHRSGFQEVAKWLHDNRPDLKKQALQEEGGASPLATMEHGQNEQDDLIQLAFRGLPLKDKLGLNLFVQKYRKRAARKKAQKGEGDSMEDEASGDIGSESQSREESVNGTASWDGDCRGKDDIDLRFISDQDRESLKVAMSMMSSEELEELKRNSPYSDVRNWMLRSNYESLKEASAQLEKQAMRKKLSSAQGTSLSSSSTQSSEARRTASNAKLSQALAMLVLRKNLLKTKTPQAS